MPALALLVVGLPCLAPQAAAQGIPSPRSTAAATSATKGGLSADLMYRLLVGDIALQRGQPTIAARAFYEAARESRNAAFARRATEIAVATRQRATALQSARLWSELDPAAERPKQVIATLGSPGGEAAADTSTSALLQGHLERVLADSAKDPAALGEAFLQLNSLLAQELERPEAFRLIQALVAPYDNVAEAHYALALAAYNTGLTEMSIAAAGMKAVDRALVLRPWWDRAVLLKAELLRTQSVDSAITWLETAFAANGDSRVIGGGLARLYVHQKRFADARAVLDRVLAADPANRETLLARAALAVQMKDWPAAEAAFRTLQQGGDEDGAIALSLAEVAEESGRLDLAIERYKAVPEGERAWLAQLRVAVVLARMKRLDEARRYLADLPAVTIDQRVQVRQTEGQILRDAGQTELAYNVLEQGLREHPDNADLLYDAAMLAEKLDRVPVAEAHLRKVLEQKPDSAQALNALGYTLVDRTDRHEEGFRYIEKAHKLSPEDPFILDSMGWAYFRLGRLAEAESFLRRALEGRPDPEIAAHLGEVLWVKGERDRAKEVWRVQLEATPDNPVLRQTIKRLDR